MKWIAHRGESKHLIENTLSSFLKAATSDYDGIECDIRLTKDQKFVIFHDEDTMRLTGVKHFIHEMTLDEVKKLTLSYNNLKETIPTLSEYLNICHTYKKEAIIELKTILNEKEVDILHHELTQFQGMQYRLISFHLDQLKALSRFHPVQFLFENYEQASINTLIEEGYKDFSFHHETINEKVIQILTSNGVSIGVWTVDDPLKQHFFEQHHIDMLTTNKKTR
jgi:glycerophosphoryl diester phosphodiesterase